MCVDGKGEHSDSVLCVYVCNCVCVRVIETYLRTSQVDEGEDGGTHGPHPFHRPRLDGQAEDGVGAVYVRVYVCVRVYLCKYRIRG